MKLWEGFIGQPLRFEWVCRRWPMVFPFQERRFGRVPECHDTCARAALAFVAGLLGGALFAWLGMPLP